MGISVVVGVVWTPENNPDKPVETRQSLWMLMGLCGRLVILALAACAPTLSANPMPQAVPTDDVCETCAREGTPQSQIMLIGPPDPDYQASAGETSVFPLVICHHMFGDQQIRVSLETIAGLPWQAGLRFAGQELIHDGRSKIETTLLLKPGELATIQVEIYVPVNAQRGDAKTVLVQVASVTDPNIRVSTTLFAYLP